MISGLDRLPTKLRAAVKEYLRQRDSGALQGHWTISLQLAKLLRGAYLTGDESVIKATKEVLCGMDMESAMLVCSIANRMTTSTDSMVEEVRLAPTELQAEITGYSPSGNSKTTMVMEGDHQILLDEDEDSAVHVMKRNELADVTSMLERGNISRCVIISTGIHCTQGIAICPGGSRVFARAARRLGIPVTVAAARFSFVYTDDEGDDLPKRKRAHPGIAVTPYNFDGDNNTDIVRYKNDHLPIEEVSLVMTEQGGYHPKYVKTLTSND